MQELIKITTQEGRQVVSARDLHSFLEVATDFRHWVPRMFEYGFSESVDYTPVIFEHPQNKQQTTDYALTLDCAKEISMIQRTEKGKQARLYFIEMEKRAQGSPVAALTRKDLAQMLLDAENEIEQLQLKTGAQEKELKTAAPKVVYHDKVLQSGSLMPITVIAKELGMSGEALNSKLHELGIQYKIAGQWVLYAKYHGQGWTGTKTTTFTDSEGREKTVQRTYWTEKGRWFIHELLNPGVNAGTYAGAAQATTLPGSTQNCTLIKNQHDAYRKGVSDLITNMQQQGFSWDEIKQFGDRLITDPSFGDQLKQAVNKHINQNG